MIAQGNDKYYVVTKVRGIGKGAVPGEYFGWTKGSGAKIDAQPFMREIATNPEAVDGIVISNMIVKVILDGHEHPIGALDEKYRLIGVDHLIKVRNFEITGYDAYKEKEYIKLGMNITFEITKDQAEQWMTKNRKTWTESKESQKKSFSMHSI